MLRYVFLWAALSLMFLSALTPLQAQTSSGCASTAAATAEDVCLAPGFVASSRVPAKKTCHACTFVDHPALPASPDATMAVGDTPDAIHATGRVISPDRRPPRA
ncbi:hypothetical protein CLG85_001225 [Yangia mangrovi]|uniref:DUF2946 domain-containing protein n=1 Tax=Alloyangia mangrovi TaxID=1779329 RepID=A0A2A3K095_9RHOB|nr:hypothetical protein [Alloyangia mangrovi]MCA0942870.1 hypothetical protein [Alloyangia pacifica]MCA0948161.1 hypothetical protein [Alloyangia pacifica]MCT4369031.1 hypothetical protein [Alloyangia mangrovi]